MSFDASQAAALDRALGRYKQIIPNSAASKGIRKALKPMLEAAKSEVPVGGRVSKGKRSEYDQGGATRRDLRIRIVKPEGDEAARGLVGVSKKRGKVGWRTHLITRKNKNRKAPDNFLERAYRQTIDQTVQILGTSIEQSVRDWAKNNLPHSTQ